MVSEADVCYLSSVMIDDNVLVDYPLLPSDFGKISLRVVYEAMLDMKREKKPIDLVTLVNHLQEHNTLETAGGIKGVTYIHGAAPSAKLAGSYAQIVIEQAQRRAAQNIGGRLAKLDDTGDVAQALEDAQAEITNTLLRNTTTEKTKLERVTDFARWVERRAQQGTIPGITTGNCDLDKLIAGWQDGDLVILAARPGMGKTALALNFVFDAAYAGVPSKFYSLEMPCEQIYARLAARFKGLTVSKLFTPYLMNDEDWGAFVKATDALNNMGIEVDDSKKRLADLVRQVRRDVSQGIKLIVVDYLQLIVGDRRENRTQEVSQISGALKALALDLKIPIIALSQLSRGVEARNDKRPLLSDLRESGTIEQDADIVMLLYRASYYNEQTDDLWSELTVAKHRKGEQGRVRLYFYPDKMRFTPLAPDYLNSVG